MKNVLITGGAGFIGVNLSLLLLKSNYKVTVLDNLSPQIHGENGDESFLFKQIKGKVDFIKNDVCDKEVLQKAMKKADVLIHLAAETGTGQSMYQIEKYTTTNIVATSHIIDILTNGKHSVEKVLYASTRAVYGEGSYLCEKHGIVYPKARNENDMLNGDLECKCPICNLSVSQIATSELSLPSPSSLYAVSKLSSEQLLQVQCGALGIPFTGLRLQNVYGAGQSLKNPYTGILSIFSNLLLKNKTINIFEDGRESRDFIHVKDVAKAFLLALESVVSDGEIINIGSGVGTTVDEITELLKQSYSSSSEIKISGDFRKGDIRHNYADVSKAERLLNWQSSISLESGIQDFCKWVLTQDIEDGNSYEKSLKEMSDKGLFINKQ